MAERRVVITGLGMISPLGNNVADSWSAVVNGISGIGLIEHFDTSAFATRFGGVIKNFDVSQYMTQKESRNLDGFIQYGVAAGIQAFKDSGLEITEEIADRVGAVIGSGIGGISSIEKNKDIVNGAGPRRISPFFVPGSIVNMIAGTLSIKYKLRGPNIAITTACTTATHSIGVAARMIKYGEADAMLAGGSEMAMTPVGLGGFCAARALSKRNDEPTKASRPWDKDRDGFVLSDGAAVMVLEEYEFAKQRGASIYAELCGFGMSSDAYHITLPHPEGSGAAKSMQQAAKDAKVNASDIDYINAHGTSTNAGDLAETNGVKTFMGDSAKQVAISSTKSMTGHALGAAGALEAIFSVMSIKDQVAPPTINLLNPDEGCDLNYVPNTAQEIAINLVMSNSFGFGGTNGTLLFRKIV